MKSCNKIHYWDTDEIKDLTNKTHNLHHKQQSIINTGIVLMVGSIVLTLFFKRIGLNRIIKNFISIE